MTTLSGCTNEIVKIPVFYPQSFPGIKCGERLRGAERSNGQQAFVDNSAALVKKPLMLSAALPRTFTPGDTLDIPLTVFAMNNSIHNVEVQLTTNDKIKIRPLNRTTGLKRLVFSSCREVRDSSPPMANAFSSRAPYTNDKIKILGQSRQETTFREKGENLLWFKLCVNETSGVAALQFSNAADVICSAHP